MKGMMATILILFIQSEVPVKVVRDAYFESAKGTVEAKKFAKLLDSVKEDAAPVLLCYKGAAEMLKAKNTVSPISKYSFFKRGKALIEAAISRDTSCLESHFIRFSIQRNLPGFLGYNRNIMQDSMMVVKGLPELNDEDLKFKIVGYFSRLKAGNNKSN